jgi:hypothetical protein
MCGESNGVLWICVSLDIYAAIPIFCDPARIGVIIDLTVKDGEELRRIEWDGYTQLHGILSNADGVSVGLKKGASE